MPVVQLYLDRLHKLVGKNTDKKKILGAIPFLGLDIEEQTTKYIRVEYSPNRPDYATEFGIAAGIQGLLGIKKGLVKLVVKKGNYNIKVDSSIRGIRPYITAIVAKNGKLDDDETIRQIIALQEDLHCGIGRKRKKTSIGLHDLDKMDLSFPSVRYTTTNRNHKFIPLDSTKQSSIAEILANTEVGQKYGPLLENSTNIPIIVDSKGNTISFPPIINSALTKVSTTTTNLFVEVTGTDKSAAEDTLSVVAATLQGAGFELYSVKISGANNASPKLKTRQMTIDAELVNKILGLQLSPSLIVASLRKSRLDARVISSGVSKNKTKISCVIPRSRFDIMGTMDLVEEVALGYGISNLEPTLPPSADIGGKTKTTTQLEYLSQIMIGLGFTEVVNSSLGSKQIQYDQPKRNSSQSIQVVESKSQEHTILRDAILPGLLNNISKNIHEQYPQKLFETGAIFLHGSPIKEEIHLACISAHKDASFSEIKSILQSAFKTGFNIECDTKTSSHPTFSDGKTANILVNNRPVGVVGQVDSGVVANFRIRVSLAAFEIKLSALIFD